MTRHQNFSIFPGRTPRGTIMGAVCVALIVLLAACAGGSTSPSSSSSSSTTTGGGTLSGGTDISGKTILFEIQSSPSDSFFVPVVNGAKAAAAIAGLKLQIQYASNDDTTEVNQVNTALASNVAGVALSIPDAGLNKAVCDARAKGTPVVAFNIDGSTGAGAKCVMGFVGQDFVQSGALIAQKMIDAGQIKPGDHVFCPVEFPAQVYAAQRYAGVKQALSAAKQVGRNIPIGGFDVTSDILSSIKSGTITATVDQQPYVQGFQSVMQLALHLKYAIAPSK